MKREIHVTISPKGEITVEAHGFQGKGCEAASKAIEQALGATAKRTHKPEYWQREINVRQNQRIGGGPDQ